MIDRDLIKKMSQITTAVLVSLSSKKTPKKQTANDLTWTFQKAQIHLGIFPACN